MLSNFKVRLMEDLFDKIYEAAIAPDVWPTVMEGLSDVAGGDGGVIFTHGLQKWIASPKAHDRVKAYVDEGWHTRTSRTERLIKKSYTHPGFIGDLDVFTRDELEREDVYSKFLRPVGWGWGAATIVSAPSGDLIAIDIERRFDRGPIEPEIIHQLDVLRPHLARAGLLSGRLFNERLNASVAALNSLGLAAAILGDNGKIIAVNQRLEELMPCAIHDRRGLVSLQNHTANGLLSEAISNIGPSGDRKSVRSIPLAATDYHSPLILHLIPVRGVAHDIFSGARAFMVITPLKQRAPLNVTLLQGLFDLTPAESRIALAISHRKQIDDMAVDFGVSRETIRSQVKSVLAKTACASQGELSILLTNSSIFD